MQSSKELDIGDWYISLKEHVRDDSALLRGNTHSSSDVND
jgi:hypothetical protein